MPAARVGESLQSRLRDRLERAPERRALAFCSADGAVDWLSLEEVERRAAAVAALLVEQGLAPGDVAILVLPSDELAATTLLATLSIGAVPLLVAVPVVAGSPLDLPQTVARLVRESHARLVVCTESMAGALDVAEVRRGARVLNGIRPATSPQPLPAVTKRPASHDVAALQLTSGTTGVPRICVWEQRAVLAALDGMARAMGLADDDVCLTWTPLYHDMGLVNNFLLCITHGVPLALLSPEEFVKRPALWIQGLSRATATLSWSPNFGFALAARRVTDEELAGVRLDHVRALWNAAERIHRRTVVEFCRRYRHHGLRTSAVRANFGLAENVGGATFGGGRIVVEDVDREALFREGIARPRPRRARGDTAAASTTVVGVGRPCPGVEVEILSVEGRPLPEGFVGEIALSTPSRMRGYLNDPVATRSVLRGARLVTGDLGYLRGGELFWVGRVRERITVRGKKLDPSDFEPVLAGIAGLREGCFAAFGVDDEEQGTQRIVIASEVREPLGREPGEIAAEIQREAFLRLGVTVDEVSLVRPRTLGKTSSGKRRHGRARLMYLQGAFEERRVDGGRERRSSGPGTPPGA
jgi:acyl-CoA synthetase (AMP-forming)/AMP-acid ligase II